MSRSAEAVESLAGTRVGQSAGDFMRHCVGLMKTTREKMRPVEEKEREDEDVLVAHPFYDIEASYFFVWFSFAYVSSLGSFLLRREF